MHFRQKHQNASNFTSVTIINTSSLSASPHYQIPQFCCTTEYQLCVLTDPALPAYLSSQLAPVILAVGTSWVGIGLQMDHIRVHKIEDAVTAIRAGGFAIVVVSDFWKAIIFPHVSMPHIAVYV
jgi:hypothetical protein